MEKIKVLLPVNGKIKSGCIKNTAGNKSGYLGFMKIHIKEGLNFVVIIPM